MSRPPDVQPTHSPAFVALAWISFACAVGSTAIGIWHLPVDTWMRAFLAMGLLFTTASSLTLAKTVRDLHEGERLHKRIDEARVSRFIAEHDPLKPPA